MSTTRPPAPPGSAVRDDPALPTMVQLALVRLARGLPVWTALAPPLVLSALLLVAVVPAPGGTPVPGVWDHWLGLTLYLWALLAPMAAALFAIGADQADEQAKRVMYGYAFPRHRLLFAAFTAISLLWLASALLLALLVAGASLAFGTPDDALRALTGAVVPVLAAWPTLVLCLAAAEAWGTAGVACAGTVGMLFGALAGDKALWWVFPPAWPTRSVIPIAETRGIGDYYAPGHPMLDPGVLPWLALAALVLTAAALTATAQYTDRREL